MNIYDQIIESYPELQDKDFEPSQGIILLRDDGDGIQYIAKWEYEKPIPAGLSFGKNQP